MSNTNTGGPAFPGLHPSADCRYQDEGMTLRQYAAIKLKVPNSGTDWLDEMIRTAQRDELAARAMQGNIASMVEGQEFDSSMGAEWAYKVADAMLKAREA